ncbi:MAG TPA: glycosyltransferase [Pirellulales bacterium]|nr:glycosyltransferase [Pirellulales bacterium]
MKLSIIAPVLNSHEALRRQMLFWHQSGIPTRDTEIIIMDDGSDPPLEESVSWPWNGSVRIVPTNDFRPWTWALARNAGARLASGKTLLMFDLDHIITRQIVEFVLENDMPRIHFIRRFGVLDADGNLLTDRPTLEAYGLTDQRSRIESHHNSFAMQKKLFWKLGGYREDLIGRPYPQGEDSDFYNRWKAYAEECDVSSLEGPTMYMFPTGRFCGDVDHDEQRLFHTLSRKSTNNYWWNQQRKDECQKDLHPISR